MLSLLFSFSRFVINIPDEDKDDVMMLCSWIEPAHWFYLDFLRPDDPSLPACSLKEFMASSECSSTQSIVNIVCP